MSDMHFWVFAVKYLSKGIEYTRLKANDRADYALKTGLYFLLALFELYIGANLVYEAVKFPVFKPPNTISALECDHLYADYILKQQKWYQRDNKVAHTRIEAYTVYILLCCVMTGVGVYLIYNFTQQIVAFYKD